MRTIVESYYDTFSERQKKAGIHKRHFAIRQWLIRLGLKKNDSVLEIGCGVGTVTFLLAEYLSKGSIIGNDISGDSIKIAKANLSEFKNVRFVQGDITAVALNELFDVVVMPDVLEHIPENVHGSLFKKIDQCLKPGGSLFIHIPEPGYHKWYKQKSGSEIQIVDEPVLLSSILKNIEGTQLHISFCCSYCLWNTAPDYQVLKFIKMDFMDYQSVNERDINFLSRVIKRIFRVVGREKRVIPF